MSSALAHALRVDPSPLGSIDISRALEIDGALDDTELRWLALRARECRVIVEAGCYKGRSTRALADHCQGVVYAVDPWDEATRLDFESNLADHLAAKRVGMWPTTFADAAPALVGLGADLVFIDGDHRYETVLNHISLARRIVRPGATIAGHGYTRSEWPGVRQAVQESFRRLDGVCHSIWLSIDSTTRRTGVGYSGGRP